jgi:tetratricopeptide (TPR) repeat protein
VLVAYAPSLGAGFLNYDDPWLLTHNRFYAEGMWRTPWVAFFDLTRETRLTLGAEYLPVRDVFVWLETRAFGVAATPLHAVSVLLYLIGLLYLRGAFGRVFGKGFAVELAILLFALHPVHVESVGWLAGQKDVLALAFIGAALDVHARGARHASWAVPLLVLAACFSKSMSVAVIALLVAQDLVLKRRPKLALYAGALAAISLAMVMHLYVGRVVGMFTEPAGGSRVNALITMGPVWLRYLGISAFPWRLSIAYDVPDRTCWDLRAIAGYAFVVVAAAIALFALARRNARLPLFLFLWCFCPLLPVSQILIPLQNRMADRYLWLSVMAPCALVGWALAALYQSNTGAVARRFVLVLSGLACLSLAAASFERAVVFSDSLLLFTDGTQKTRFDTDAPYQLGKALEELGRDDEAMVAFGEVLTRSPSGPEPNARAASNNLARLLARQGRLQEAEQVLKAALSRFPRDRKLTGNLVKVLKKSSPASGGGSGASWK